MIRFVQSLIESLQESISNHHFDKPVIYELSNF